MSVLLEVRGRAIFEACLVHGERLSWTMTVAVGCRNAVVLVLSNGFSIGCLSAVALNLLLPFEQSTEMQNVSYVPGGVHPVGPNGKIIDSTQDFEVGQYLRHGRAFIVCWSPSIAKTPMCASARARSSAIHSSSRWVYGCHSVELGLATCIPKHGN